MTATLLQEMQNGLTQDLVAFAPELLLCAGIWSAALWQRFVA